MTGLYQKIYQELLAAERILIIGHRRPDEDACGSALSLFYFLTELGKQAKIFCADLPPKYLSFMPLISEIQADQRVFEEDFDLLVFVDCGSIGNTGIDEALIRGKKIINIDHHASNNGYGLINLVAPTASSTCEVLFEFFSGIDRRMDKRTATCLLSGIMGDTSGFLHSTTKPRTLAIASELIKYGVKINQIFHFVVHNKTIGGLKLWGEIFSRIKFNPELGIAYTYIFDHDFADFNAGEDELDGMANMLNAIVEAQATVLFRISPDKLRASWRTKRDDIDLSALCARFGGGGHKKASGFTVPWKVVEKDGRLVIV